MISCRYLAWWACSSCSLICWTQSSICSSSDYTSLSICLYISILGMLGAYTMLSQQQVKFLLTDPLFKVIWPTVLGLAAGAGGASCLGDSFCFRLSVSCFIANILFGVLQVLDIGFFVFRNTGKGCILPVFMFYLSQLCMIFVKFINLQIQFASIIQLLQNYKIIAHPKCGLKNKLSQIIKMKNRSQKKNYRQSYMIRRYAKSQTKKQQQRDPIVFMVVDDQSIGVHLPSSASNDMTRTLIRENQGVWEPNFKLWKIPRSSYTAVRSQIPRIAPQAQIEDIPLFIDKAGKPMPERLYMPPSQVIMYDPLDKRIPIKQNPLYDKLYQFQKISVELAIKNFGRLLIADEMGIGKSLQALACALAYETDWPLLIICPSGLKTVWREEVKKWIGDRIKKQYIQVVEKFGTALDFSVLKIAIYSYEIAAKSVEQLSRFKIVIADEAHYLKNTSAKRTESLVPFLTSRKRVLLLSGTPALAKPRQVYNLISIIRPDIYNNFKQFGNRYCVLQRNKWSHKMQYDGCKNSAELHYLLKNKIMIRRLKYQVLHQLPEKQRQIIQLQTCKTYVKQIKQLMSSKQIPIDVLRNNEKLVQYGQNSQNFSPLSKCYLLTGLAKLQSTKTYLTQILQNDVKILIFAHHKAVMDELQQHLKKILVDYIRIDGSTSNDMRKKHIKNFQQNLTVRAALLSITAAGVGITLTAASNVIFAQLHWTPANLIQAQDRAHRIGQKSCVNIHYLIGENTIDHILLKQLEKKLQTTGDILNGIKQSLEAQNVQKGKMGRLSRTKFDNPQTKTQQRSILDYTRRTNPDEGADKQQSDIDEQDKDIPQDEIQKLIMKKQMEIREKNKIKLLIQMKEKERLDKQKDKEKEKQKQKGGNLL